jgi:arginyl-tRNA synthetase
MAITRLLLRSSWPKQLVRIRERLPQFVQAAIASISQELAKVDIAGPGFHQHHSRPHRAKLNLYAPFLPIDMNMVVANALAGVKINLEFISANPTGPLHLGHTRWAAVGDSLGRVLSAAGAQVTREFYINDRGRQMDLFGQSVQAAALGQPIPEDGYQGNYIADLAKEVVAANPAISTSEEFREAAYHVQLAQQQRVLKTFIPTLMSGFLSARSINLVQSNMLSKNYANKDMSSNKMAQCGYAPQILETIKIASFSRKMATSHTSHLILLITSISANADLISASTCLALIITVTSTA